MAITMVADKEPFEENLFRGHDKDITESLKTLLTFVTCIVNLTERRNI